MNHLVQIGEAMSEVAHVLDEPQQSVSLNAFSDLSKGDPAPFWLFSGVCAIWGLQKSQTTLDLITVSENATFLLKIHGVNEGVIRVSQPGYVGGPEAVASEILWLNALHDVAGINLINPVPTIRGTFVGTVRDRNDVGWTVISTKFVSGTVLEDLDNPAPYYTTIGSWAAKFHEQSQHWKKPFGFRRFNWDISNMVGPSPRWGRWEDASLTQEQRSLCEKALWKAMDVVMKTPRNPQTWGLIHADLRPSNIIRDNDGTLTVIDFDDAGYSWYLYDYASSLSFIEHMPYAPALAKSWIAGYESVAGAFDDGQLAVMSALSMIRRLQMLGWTTNHRKDALPQELATTQVSGTVDCAHRYLEDSLWLLR